MEQQTIALKVGHVGAARDEHSYDISPAGFYCWVGPHATGKSTIDQVMELLNEAPDVIASRFPITHGEDRAWFELATRRLDLSLSVTGLPRASVSGQEVAVESVPDVISTLLDPGIKDLYRRAAARLKALLAYFPVATSPERLDELLGCLIEHAPGATPKPRAFAEIPQDLRDAWREQSFADPKMSDKIFRPLMDPGQIREWLEGQPAGKWASILGAHDLLFGPGSLIDNICNVGRKAVLQQDQAKARADGRAEEVLSKAREEQDAALKDLQAEHDREALVKANAEAEAAIETARRLHAAREAEKERRETIRGKLASERPEVDATRRDVLATQIEPARQALADAENDLQDLRVEVRTALERRGQQKRAVFERWEEFDGIATAMARAITKPGCALSPEGQDDVCAPSEPLSVSSLTRAASRLAQSTEDLAEDSAPAAREALEAGLARQVIDRETLDRLKTDLRSAQEDVARQERDQKRWDEINAELDADLPPPADVTDAKVAAEKAGRALVVADLAHAYQAAAAEVKTALERSADFGNLIKAYEHAKAAALTHLGQIITHALPERIRPWLMVDGTRVFTAFRDGSLNDAPELVDAAYRAAREAVTRAGAGDGGLLERVRRLSEGIDWRDMDSNEVTAKLPDKDRSDTGPSWAQSKSEMTLSALSAWLEGQESGTFRKIPVGFTDALDGQSKREVSRKCAEKDMRVFSARPADTDRGDPEELHLVFVHPERGEERLENLAEAGGAE